MDIAVTDQLSERYSELPKSAGNEDKYLIGFLIVFALLLIVAVFQRRDKVKYYISMNIIGIFIILGLFGSGWAVGVMRVDNALLSVYSDERVTSDMNVNIGVRGFNVTLLEWNEYFSWSYPRWRHEVLEEHVREALTSGIPYPIYWVAEAMVIDAEYIRWGREFRESGLYVWVFLWTSFTCLTVSVLFMILDQKNYSGLWVIFTSVMMFTAWISWLILRPETFIIPLSLGWTFITTVIGSVYSLLIGLTIFVKQD